MMGPPRTSITHPKTFRKGFLSQDFGISSIWFNYTPMG
jgi:hypothetical protein